MPKGNGDSRARILQLRARNVKIIREVEIDLDGDIHEIRGDTGEGKTSILASIEGALRGLDPDMVRRGESKAEIELTLSNAVVKRIVPADGSADTLLISDAAGKPIDKAKDFLKTICGPSTFRPIEWVNLSGGDARGKTERLRKQRDQLLESIPIPLTDDDVIAAVQAKGEACVDALAQVNLDGVNFEQHAFVVCRAIESACYEFRKLQNSRAEEEENRLKLTPAPERPAPRADLVSLLERERQAVEAYHRAKARAEGHRSLGERREALRAKILAEETDLPDLASLEKTHQTYQTDRASLTKGIAEIEGKLKSLRERLGEVEEKLSRCESLKHRIDAQAARRNDLAEIDRELAGQEEVEDRAALEKTLAEARADVEARRLQDMHDAAAERAVQARGQAALFDTLVELFRDELPKTLLASANLPIEGLGIDEDKIVINGVPLHQLGTSQQIRLGVVIAAALNPRSGFVLVDGSESLGRRDRLALADAAKSLGLQLIMTCVDPDASPSDGVTVMKAGAAVTGS